MPKILRLKFISQFFHVIKKLEQSRSTHAFKRLSHLDEAHFLKKSDGPFGALYTNWSTAHWWHGQQSSVQKLSPDALTLKISFHKQKSDDVVIFRIKRPVWVGQTRVRGFVAYSANQRAFPMQCLVSKDDLMLLWNIEHFPADITWQLSKFGSWAIPWFLSKRNLT